MAISTGLVVGVWVLTGLGGFDESARIAREVDLEPGKSETP